MGRPRTSNTLKGFCTFIFFLPQLENGSDQSNRRRVVPYGGSKLVALDEDSIAYASGMACEYSPCRRVQLVFVNENEPNGRRSGLALAYCPDTKQIAVAPRSGNVVANKEGGNDAGPGINLHTLVNVWRRLLPRQTLV